MSHHENESFSQRFPDAGEVRLGAHLTGEQARQFADVISSRVFELSRKQTLNDAEMTFIDRIMDLTARTIVYGVNQKAMHLVLSREAHATRNAVAKLRDITEDLPFDHLIDEMGGITFGSVSMRGSAATRHLVEDVAGHGMQLFGQMVEDIRGVTLDTYLEGNLQDMMQAYDAIATDN